MRIGLPNLGNAGALFISRRRNKGKKNSKHPSRGKDGVRKRGERKEKKKKKTKHMMSKARGGKRE